MNDYVWLNALYLPFIAAMHYLGLNGEQFLILTSLFFIDFFTGVIKSFVKENFSNRALWVGFMAKFLFLLIPIVTALGIKALGGRYLFLLEFILSGLILSEVFSVFRNIYIIKTKKEVPDFDFLGMLIKYLRKILLKDFEK